MLLCIVNGIKLRPGARVSDLAALAEIAVAGARGDSRTQVSLLHENSGRLSVCFSSPSADPDASSVLRTAAYILLESITAGKLVVPSIGAVVEVAPGQTLTGYWFVSVPGWGARITSSLEDGLHLPRRLKAGVREIKVRVLTDGEHAVHLSAIPWELRAELGARMEGKLPHLRHRNSRSTSPAAHRTRKRDRGSQREHVLR